jgi:hypothetical protein
MALCTSRWQVHSQDANIASSTMVESIGKACLCPSFLHTHFVRIYGRFGFHGQNPSLQHSGISLSNLKVTSSNLGSLTTTKASITFVGLDHLSLFEEDWIFYLENSMVLLYAGKVVIHKIEATITYEKHK